MEIFLLWFRAARELWLESYSPKGKDIREDLACPPSVNSYLMGVVSLSMHTRAAGKASVTHVWGRSLTVVACTPF